MYFTPGANAHESVVTIEPLHHGYGVTVGNALRRVLLSSLPGAAAIAVKIKGVQHEFSAMNGVKEDVLHIVLNLKKLRVKVYSDEPVVVRLSKKGVGEVTAADITANADVEIINPELVLANITDEKGNLDMEITLSKGRGYSPTEDRENTTGEIGVIAIDAMFSPVRVVGLHVENTRVGDITNYDKLIMTVTTDGTITPQEAVAQATKILLNHFTWIQGQLDHASLTEQLNRKSESSDNE